jgi:hypothetical protein
LLSSQTIQGGQVERVHSHSAHQVLKVLWAFSRSGVCVQALELIGWGCQGQRDVVGGVTTVQHFVHRHRLQPGQTDDRGNPVPNPTRAVGHKRHARCLGRSQAMQVHGNPFGHGVRSQKPRKVKKAPCFLAFRAHKKEIEPLV